MPDTAHPPDLAGVLDRLAVIEALVARQAATPAPQAAPPITIGPFTNVPAPGSPIRSDWAQQITNFVVGFDPGVKAGYGVVAGSALVTITNGRGSIPFGVTFLPSPLPVVVLTNGDATIPHTPAVETVSTTGIAVYAFAIAATPTPAVNGVYRINWHAVGLRAPTGLAKPGPADGSVDDRDDPTDPADPA